MTQMSGILAALGPVFALVLLGYLLRTWNFPGQAFWPLAERFTYFLLFPCLLVQNLASASLDAESLGTVVTALVLTLSLASLVALLLGRLLAIEGAALTSYFQGAVRFNTYVGLAAAAGLYGEAGLLWGALFLAVTIPLVNLYCVLLFAWCGEQARSPSVREVLLNVLKNPLIVACLLGIGLNLSGLGLPPGSAPVLALLSPMALPLGLLAVGVGLDMRALRGGGRALWVSAGFRLLFYPLFFLMVAWGLGVPSAALGPLLLFALLPTAPSAYILARQLGGDAPLMASIITLQTLLAMATMTLLLSLLA
ncbi:AEC family transporter [Motiliproteus sp. SC1-56]|uniref:AEC family transporter n=1 Tax=Motiliproteus sp. SC1-56 TaxID=2799565 RepID=UPI001F5D74AA|nr:AEC family transporter [Motiliproteus sp. SC1-56]